jgi:hypothetical protein
MSQATERLLNERVSITINLIINNKNMKNTINNGSEEAEQATEEVEEL